MHNTPFAAASPSSATATPWRLAVVTETWPPEVNGVAATAARVVQGLQMRGHALNLVRPRQHGDGDVLHGQCLGQEGPGQLTQTLVRSLPVPRYPELRMGLPATRLLLQRWQAQRPDVVHVVTEGPLGWSAVRAARALDLPVVSDFRTNFHAYSRHYGAAWLYRPIVGHLRRLHNRTHSTLVPTQALQQELAGRGFQRLLVVARGVDTQRFDPSHRSGSLRARWGAGPHTTVALCVGRLAPEKNLGVLVQAFEAMRLRDPQMLLVLVGDGPLRAALQARHPQLVFAGVQQGQALAEHYASADVFLFPSETETYGNVVPEAMASGLAVVAYDLAAAALLVRHGHSGLLARSGEPRDFLQVAAGLASDRARVRALGLQARQVALQHGWDRIVSQVEAVYAGVLNATASQSASGWPVAAAQP
jgi:glycosyltransferase involved in cell wall biosynthesis